MQSQSVLVCLSRLHLILWSLRREKGPKIRKTEQKYQTEKKADQDTTKCQINLE